MPLRLQVRTSPDLNENWPQDRIILETNCPLYAFIARNKHHTRQLADMGLIDARVRETTPAFQVAGPLLKFMFGVEGEALKQVQELLAKIPYGQSPSFSLRFVLFSFGFARFFRTVMLIAHLRAVFGRLLRWSSYAIAYPDTIWLIFFFRLTPSCFFGLGDLYDG